MGFGALRRCPDHPKIKSVSRTFEKTGADPGFRFFGNIAVGHDVSADELAERYDAVVYAVGTQSDRALGIPGESLRGSVAAVDFVGWYNAHPHFAEMAPDISSGRAVVIGNGNVAIDVARIPVTDPDVLATTDIADHALDSLHHRGVSEVVVVGRRGAAGGRVHHPGVARTRRTRRASTWSSTRRPGGHHRRGGRRRRQDHRRQHQSPARVRGRPPLVNTGGNRRIVFRFRTSPIEITGTRSGRDHRAGPQQIVHRRGWAGGGQDTGERETLPTQLVVRAVGYRGVAIPGLPFDDRSGTIPHTEGHITGRDNDYVVGWIKRGPSGVIGTNKSDSQDTVNTLIADLAGKTAARDRAGLCRRTRRLAADLPAQAGDRRPLAPHRRPRTRGR